MEELFTDNLHHFSLRASRVQIDKSEIYQLIHIYNEYWMADFLDYKHYIFQREILAAPKEMIHIILKNLDDSIKQQAGNNIDLSSISLTERFEYSSSSNHVASTIKDKYIINYIFPEDSELFKKYWLKHFLKDCKQIAWNIRTVLGLEQPQKNQNYDINELLNSSEKILSNLNEDTKNLFSENKSKHILLATYFDEIFPKYIENTDFMFFALDKMTANFDLQFSYLEDENNKLKQLIFDLKEKHFEKINKMLSTIEVNDKSYFLQQLDNAILHLKQKKTLKEQQLSKFTEILYDRIKSLKDITEPIITENRKDVNTTIKTFETFITSEKQKYVLEMLGDFSVTVNNKSILSTRKKGIIRGIVEALRENNILPQISLDASCKIIADKIGLELTSKLDYSKLSDHTYKKAIQYIKEHPIN
jgi:hypothetical protein